MSKRSFVEAYIIARTTVGHQSLPETRDAIQSAIEAYAEIEKAFPAETVIPGDATESLPLPAKTAKADGSLTR